MNYMILINIYIYILLETEYISYHNNNNLFIY